MEASNTETVRAIVLLATLVLFGLVLDPFLLWLVLLRWFTFGEVYIAWLFLMSVAVTLVVARYLLQEDKEPPQTSVRRVGRIS